MRLWTVQPVEAVDILERDGVFRCNECRSENWDDFHDAYVWLVGEMDKRNIHHPEDLVLPLWAWHTRNWKYKKPDFRTIGLGCPGHRYVCIEFEIDDKDVLLSDYGNWHYVLNKGWFDDSESEEEWEKIHEWYDSLDWPTREKMMLESWQKIFDVGPEKTDWGCKGAYIQATFWELRKDMVKDVRCFTAR